MSMSNQVLPSALFLKDLITGKRNLRNAKVSWQSQKKNCPEAEIESLAKLKPMKNTEVIKEPVNEKSNKSQEHKCDFKDKSTVTLKKHLNTKHYVNETNDNVNMKDVECFLCEYRFYSKRSFQGHIIEHLEEK